MKENEDRNAREINDDNKIKRKSNSRRNFEESLQTSIKPVILETLMSTDSKGFFRS